MEVHFKIIGALLIVLAAAHIVFPKYFKWDVELKLLSIINRQMMLVHTLFIALFILLSGILSFTSAHELVNTNLGKNVSLGFGVFWLCRLFVQFFGYSPILWKGKTFETGVHILFVIFFSYVGLVYLLNAIT